MYKFTGIILYVYLLLAYFYGVAFLASRPGRDGLYTGWTIVVLPWQKTKRFVTRLLQGTLTRVTGGLDL